MTDSRNAGFVLWAGNDAPRVALLGLNGPFNSKALFLYGFFPGSQIPSPSQVASTSSCGALPLLAANEARVRSPLAILEADPIRVSPPIHLPLSSLRDVQLHAQTAQHEVARVRDVTDPVARAVAAKRTQNYDTMERSGHLEVIDSKFSEVQVNPRFCPIRLWQRF